MQTRKAYAVSLGLANEGRGRMSREALAAIDKAISEGMTFSDMDKHHTGAKFGRTKGTAPKPVTRAPRQINLKSENVSTGVEVERPPTYSKDTFWTYTNDKGKTVKVNGIQVCTHCRFSLYWHKCGNPSAVTADGIQELEVHIA